MPQVVPRVKEIFGSGLYYISYFIALVYGAVRLLPPNHPYLQGRNIGRFSVRHVIAEAANNLVVDRYNIDKLILFFLVILGLAIALVQVILLGGSLFMQTAIAQDFFSSPSPSHDLAYMFMDLVFGVPGVFDSCVSTDVDCVDAKGHVVSSIQALGVNGFPYPIHTALHQMLRLYSTGLMIVAMMITTYFVFTVLAETAQTGTPFGKRFNKVWAPLRIVAAFALLMPLGIGLSSAQFIVLNMAKFGSNFASNGWKQFNETLNAQYESQYSNMVAKPQSPDVASLLQYLFTVRSCQVIENIQSGSEDVKPYLVRSAIKTDAALPLAWDGNPLDIQNGEPSVSYEDMFGYINGSAVESEGSAGYGAMEAKIVFGKTSEDGKFAKYEGGVEPTCGILRFSLTDNRLPYPHATPPGAEDPRQYAEPGVDLVQRYYWDMLNRLYFTVDFISHRPTSGDAECLEQGGGVWCLTADEYAKANYSVPGGPKGAPPEEGDYSFAETAFGFFATDIKFVHAIDCDPAPDEDPMSSCYYLETVFFGPQELPKKSMATLQNESQSWMVSEAFLDKGWAAAGIWYNKIAEMNGTVMEAAANMPEPVRFPMVMEKVLAKKRAYNQRLDMPQRFNPNQVASGQKLGLSADEQKKAVALWKSYDLWREIGANPYNQPTGNAFIDTIKAIFGVEGLFNLQYNGDTHPLAQLIAVGKSLVDSSIRNIGYAAIGAGARILDQTLATGVGQGADIVVKFIMSITTIAMTMGFILYYVVPFLPFIYFFFAVGGWVKGIFEALVGVPLWALAHIRIDGNGLPGQAAVSGYFLILEIFLRPILTVFGLLASISIFGALVGVLSDIWVMVTANVGGFDVRTSLSGTYLLGQEDTAGFLPFMRSSIDQFFYTVVYTIVVYMIGMSSFKLIDQIPNNILRWMGQNVSAFNDSRENPAESMVGSSYFGANQVSEKLGGAFGA